MINLNKGDKLSLTKDSTSKLAKVRVGLGWKNASSNFIERLINFFSGKGSIASMFYDIDCDASVIAMDKNGRHLQTVYYGNKYGVGITHHGDNLVGGSKGDDEVIDISLKGLPADTDSLRVVVNIYDCVSRGQHFGLIKNAYVRVSDALGNDVLCRYNLSDDYKKSTAIEVANIQRAGQGWEFIAVGRASNAKSVSDLVREITR